MGRAQGEACRDEVRRALFDAGVAQRGRLPASLLPFIEGPVLGKGMGREIVRHYPHLSERIQGIARGAGQPIASLMELFVRSATGGADALAPAPGAARSGEAPLLLRPISSADWLIRRSRPEVGFASVELTLPWLASALAGVNEAGVAALVAPREPARRDDLAPAAPLLVQECLQRFHDVAGCIDWCRKRPVSGVASIVVADAQGELAAVEVAGDERRVVEPAGAVLLAGGCADRHPDLRKSLESAASPGDVGVGLGARVVLSPAERCLLASADETGSQRFSVA
jgi:hypothetical protein